VKGSLTGPFGILPFLLLLFSGCSGAATPPDTGDAARNGPGLKDRYRDHFLVGSMIQDGDIAHPSRAVQRHCSIVTVNHFYWNVVEPEPGTYDFGPADRRVAYAEQQGMKIRGHPLLFGTWDPAWVFKDGQDQISPERLIRRMRDHIHRIVSRYKGRIHYWDVVNEPAADIFFNLGSEPSPITDVYKRHGWYNILGESYLELALRFAHEADPEAKLYVNENNLEGLLADLSLKKRNFFAIIETLLDRGAPLHGIGIQGHWAYDYPPAEDLVEIVEHFSSLGLDVQITEMDMSTYTIARWAVPALVPVHESYTPTMERRQTERYDEFFRVFQRCSPGISAVVFWGLSDPTSWLNTYPDERPDWPLLFDEHFEPKQAFYAVMDE